MAGLVIKNPCIRKQSFSHFGPYVTAVGVLGIQLYISLD